MKSRDILIARNSKDRIKYYVALRMNSDNSILVCEMRRATEKDVHLRQAKKLGQNEMYIEKRDNLPADSIIMINKTTNILSKHIIRVIGSLKGKEFTLLNQKVEQKERIRHLHKELHELKRKILICQFNNQDYRLYESRLDYIIKELNFPKRYTKSKKQPRPGVIMPKGKIKVYLGGRGGR